MVSGSINIEISGHVALVRIIFPNLNAINTALIEKLYETIVNIENNENINLIVLTGHEKAFSSGLDLREAHKHDCSTAMTSNFINDKWHYLANCKIPVIAAVSGYALGAGLEMALMCDMIVASDSAVFGQPEIKYGLIPGMGATQRLARLIGWQRASYICLTGDFFNSAQALDFGIINKIVPYSELISSSLELGKKIGLNSRIALMSAKKCIKNAQEQPLSQGMALERQMFYNLLSSKDKQDKVEEFLSKNQSHSI